MRARVLFNGRSTLGVAPMAISVEEASGRILVVNGGGVVAHLSAGWDRPLGRLRAWLPWLHRIAAPGPSLSVVPGSVSEIEL